MYTRKVDELGRSTIPVSMRRALDINEGDSLNISMEHGRIIIEKQEPTCVLCSNKVDVTVFKFKGKDICPNCISELMG